MIEVSNIPSGGGSATGTHTYYDGANPIEVRLLNNTTTMIHYVWSPADGRMILRDTVVSAFNTYMGLSVSGNFNSNTIQRLYPMTDAQGSIVAVASPSGVVLETYTYTADGLPQARNADWTAYSSGDVYASKLGWNWFYRGQQWFQTQPDSTIETEDDDTTYTSSGAVSM